MVGAAVGRGLRPGVSAALGIGSITIAGAQAPATSSGIVLGVGANASQRVVSWYTSANTRAVGAGRADLRSSSTARSPRAPSPSRPPSPRTPSTAASTATPSSTACRRTPRTPTASAPRAPGRRRTRSRRRSSTAPSTSCSSATRRSARRATCPRTAPAGTDTLNVSLAANPDAELLVSGGDQVETANTETQWNAFLALRQAAPVPVGRHHRQPRRRRQGLRPALLDAEHRPFRARSTRATRPPSPAVTTGTSTRTSCSST